MTMTLISTVTVGAGGASAINFDSVPGNFTDLFILFSPRIAATGNFVSALNFNGDNAANYSYRNLQGTGGAVSSGASSGQTATQIGYVNDAGTTANTFSNQSIYIQNYRSSITKNMSVDTVQENNGAQGISWINAQSWTGTAAISSIALSVWTGGTFVQYTTASLYGITKGSGGASVS